MVKALKIESLKKLVSSQQLMLRALRILWYGVMGVALLLASCSGDDEEKNASHEEENVAHNPMELDQNSENVSLKLKGTPTLGALEEATRPVELDEEVLEYGCSGDSLIQIKDCHLHPAMVSPEEFHYYSFTCKKTTVSKKCRLYMRGFLFWLSSVIHEDLGESMKTTPHLSHLTLPPIKLRFWLSKDTQNLRLNKAHSLELVAKSKSIGEDGDLYTYFPLKKASFKAINAFLQSTGAVTSSAGIIVTFHEDFHELSGKPDDLKKAEHRASSNAELLASFLMAAKHLSERESSLPKWAGLKRASLKSLNDWESLLPSEDPYEDLKEDYKAFHVGYCKVFSQYFKGLLGMVPLSCG